MSFKNLVSLPLGIQKHILRKQKTLTSTTAQSNANPPTSSSFMKTPAAKLPQLTAEMKGPQFHKFRTNWDVYKHITNLPDCQLHARLHNSCDDYAQTSLVNSTSNFMTLLEDHS